MSKEHDRANASRVCQADLRRLADGFGVMLAGLDHIAKATGVEALHDLSLLASDVWDDAVGRIRKDADEAGALADLTVPENPMAAWHFGNWERQRFTSTAEPVIDLAQMAKTILGGGR